MILLTLEKYFLNHGHLIIPGIGHLRFDQKDATSSNGQFISPTETIQFDSLDSDQTKPSKLFYIFLSDHLDCSVEQAMIDYANFIQNQINTNQLIDLGNLGQLKLNNGIFTYYSNFNSKDYFQDFRFDKVLIENQNENNFTATNKRWWIFPLIIAIVAIIAIILK
jgi:hypothetical protein